MSSGTSCIAADTHVHLHPIFDLDELLDAALNHFERAVPEAGPRGLWLLCLTETAGGGDELRLSERRGSEVAWGFSPGPADASIRAERRDGRTIHLLPGRQIITSENLEVLALNCRMDVADRVFDLSSLVRTVAEAGGTPVVPWGFGKWTGRRGKAVRSLLDEGGGFFLADNGNRLRGTAESGLLREGRRRGIPIMHGSDPLPLPGQARRAGSCGIHAALEEIPEDPSQAFRKLVKCPERWCRYGELAPPVQFFSSQLRMQLRKRRKPSA